MFRSAIAFATLSMSALVGCTEAIAPARTADDSIAQQRLEQRVHELEAMVSMQQKMLATPSPPAAPNAGAPDALARIVEQLIAKNGALEADLATARANAANVCTSSDVGTHNTATVPQAQTFAADPQLRALVEQLRTSPPGQSVQLSHAQQAALLRALGPTFADEARRARFKTLDGDPVPASSLRQIRNSL